VIITKICNLFPHLIYQKTKRINNPTLVYWLFSGELPVKSGFQAILICLGNGVFIMELNKKRLVKAIDISPTKLLDTRK
jgi:hypothetical protein